MICFIMILYRLFDLTILRTNLSFYQISVINILILVKSEDFTEEIHCV